MSSRYVKSLCLALALPFSVAAMPALADSGSKSAAAAVYAPITVAEVEAAQRAWGDALVAIASEYEEDGQAAAKKLAETVIDSAYGYDYGPVLFKPTLAAAPRTFRTTKDGALAYFVGGNPQFPEDGGFALKGWKSYEIQNAGIVITGNSAISMGNVRLTDAKGKVTVVDKTWGYVRDGEGKLRIVLHHSSLPYQSK